MNIYRRFLKYFKSLKLEVFVGLVCLIIDTGARLALPKVIQKFINTLSVGDVEALNTVNVLVIGLIILYLFKGLCYYGQSYLLAYVGQKVVYKLRKRLYEHLQHMSLSFHQKMQVGELISRVTNDVKVVENSVVLALPGLISQPLTLVGAITIIFITHWKLALFSFLIVPLVAVAANKFGTKMRKVSGKIQGHLSDITTIVQENFAAIRIVKAFSREDDEIEKFNESLEGNFNANLKSIQITSAMAPLVELIAVIGIVTIFWYGSREVINGNLSTGELIAFLGYMAILNSPLKLISRDFNLVQKAIGALERIFEILDTNEFIEEDADAKVLESVDGQVNFENLSMRYSPEEDEALKNINLKVEPGKVVAFVGESGAGKTTLVNLIPRFYDPTSGKVTIDGQDIRRVTLDSLRRQMAIVPQETILFKGTVAYNISYGNPDANIDQIIEAAKKANAHDFIMEFKEGYDTMVGERGESLSGGQRQRVAIARAILADPKILILDEATSALDTASEMLVQAALDEVMSNRTTFVIAHRLSTIINADMIVVLDNGEIVEKGTHQELLKKEGQYFNLYQAQQKG